MALAPGSFCRSNIPAFEEGIVWTRRQGRSKIRTNYTRVAHGAGRAARDRGGWVRRNRAQLVSGKIGAHDELITGGENTGVLGARRKSTVGR